MTTTAIDIGSFYVTNGTISADNITTDESSTYVVKIDTEKIQANDVNEPVDVQIPVPPALGKAAGGTSVSKTMYVDLLKWKKTVTVDGYISEDAITAYTKLSYLKRLRELGSVGLTIVWGTAANSESTEGVTRFSGDSSNNIQGSGVKEIGFFNKISVDEFPGRVLGTAELTSTKKDSGYKVSLQFIIATPRSSVT